jgi:hypothetical protein
LSEAYAPKARKVRRGIASLHRSELVVEDEIEARDPIDVIWNFHTRADIKLDGGRVILSLGGKQIEARILSPDRARFEVIPADPPPPQAQQLDVRNLVIRLLASKQVSIAVALAPKGKVGTSEIEPLDAWVAAANAH